MDLTEYANKLLHDMARAQCPKPKPIRKERCPCCIGSGYDDTGAGERCWYCHGAGYIEYEVIEVTKC